MSERKHQIREVARELFQSQGYKATSMQEIADRVGISKGAVYLHYRSKEALLLAIVEDIDSRLVARMNALMEDETLSPEAMLHAQILGQLDEMVENRPINEIFLQETGLSLDAELMRFIQETRYRWQQLQETFLVKVYGESLTPWRIDAAVIFNGIMQEYHISVMLEQVDLPREALGRFIVSVMNSVVSGLLEGDQPPVLREEAIPGRQEVARRLAEAAARDLGTIVDEMTETVEALELDSDEHSVVTETLAVLAGALDAEHPNKVLIRGMLASLREVTALEPYRQRLAELLDVKLV